MRINETQCKITAKPKAFIICPVRGANPEVSRKYVEQLEAAGWDVYWPPRDTNQDDDIGHRICRDNCAAIRAAAIVFIFWNGESQGSLFDLGIAFALNKPLVVIHAPFWTPHKSFQNMMRYWAAEGRKAINEQYSIPHFERSD